MTSTRTPLRGIKVLDLTQAWAGPLCTMMLADMGAEVVKIEPPGVGDHVRAWTVSGSKGASAHFIAANRNKQGMTLNLKVPRGRKIFLELARQSDVLVENFRPGVMQRFQLGYEPVREVAPRIIYCSISGFGQTGPASGNAAYDLIIQAVGGAMSVTGEEGGRPVKPGIPQADVMGGMVGAFTVLAALYGRGEHGPGCYLDLAMLDTQVMAMAYYIISFALSGNVAKPMGTKHPLLAPYEAFTTATSEIVIAIANDSHWKILCEVIETPELASDPKFSTNSARVDHRDEVSRIVEGRTQHKPADWWLAQLSDRGIPCGPINAVDQVVADPQVRHRRMLVTEEHPRLGKIIVPGVPWKLSPPEEEQPYTPAPELGEHTDVILRRLGYSAADIEALRDGGVI